MSRAQVPAVVVVPLEAINHCIETRADVRAAARQAIVPGDGETIELWSPTPTARQSRTV